MEAARTMHQAMEALAGWMTSNRLRLNAQKYKFICLGTRQQLSKPNFDALTAEFPTTCMSFPPVVHDLWVLFESELTFSRVNKMFFKSSQVSPYRKFPYDQNIR